jgi:anti-anti-sigma regulatory factor
MSTIPGDKKPMRTMNNIGIKERRVGDVTILDMDGNARVGLKFGGRSVSLQQAVECLLGRGQNQILLNFSGVSFINEAGFADLISSHIALIENGGEIRLFNLTEILRQLMVNGKVLRFFDVYESEPEAIDSFKGCAVASSQEGGFLETTRIEGG